MISAKEILLKISEALKNEGWSQNRLGEESGIEPATIHRVFARGDGKLTTILQMAKAAGLTAHDLLSEGPVTSRPPHSLEDCISHVVNAARSGGKQPESGPVPAAVIPEDIAAEIAAVLAPLDDNQRRSRLNMIRSVIDDLAAPKKLK